MEASKWGMSQWTMVHPGSMVENPALFLTLLQYCSLAVGIAPSMHHDNLVAVGGYTCTRRGQDSCCCTYSVLVSGTPHQHRNSSHTPRAHAAREQHSKRIGNDWIGFQYAIACISALQRVVG
ncbi:hypothetical protein K440DRAFT_192732 [Wilcoxina mikolae CBS 423.85]|nr:hypothetical protein K440DRAFT_192732 [Wilcoxina mikolae CBS 423.85]